MINFSNYSVSDLSIFLIILVVAIVALVVSRLMLKLSAPYFFLGLAGLIVGLLIGSLVGSALSKLPGIYGKWLPVVVNVFTSVAIIDLFIAQARPFAEMLDNIFAKKGIGEVTSGDIVVDTSVLIDGRIEKIILSGFLQGKLLIPKFILLELQSLADSADPVKRAKGRMGLDVMVNLQRQQITPIKILPMLNKLKKEKTDINLINLAKNLKARLMTLDYNLYKIAQIENLTVLNINELAESLKENFVAGEDIKVKISQKGTGNGQGIGYLDDGTMIVIEKGAPLVGRTVECRILRLHQTISGKMFFAEIKKEN